MIGRVNGRERRRHKNMRVWESNGRETCYGGRILKTSEDPEDSEDLLNLQKSDILVLLILNRRFYKNPENQMFG